MIFPAIDKGEEESEGEREKDVICGHRKWDRPGKCEASLSETPIMFQTQVIIFFLQNEEDEEDEAKRASRAGSVWQKSIILSSEQAAANNGAMPKKVSSIDNLTREGTLKRSFQSDGTGGDKKGEKGKDGNGPRRKSVGLVVRIFLYHLNNVLWSVFFL